MERDAATLVATVRKIIANAHPRIPEWRYDLEQADAALTELAERLKVAERERDEIEWNRKIQKTFGEDQWKRANALEAERDALVEALEPLLTFDLHATEYLFGHTNGPLRVIPSADVDAISEAQQIARDALAKVKEGVNA